MKILRFSIIGSIVLLIAACSNTTRFPVSSVVPAAEIKAKTKYDEYNNKIITVDARNLASPERVDPSSSAYVIWAESEHNEIRNLGQLKNKNADKATLTAITPFQVKEIFITTESDGAVLQPSGTEIARVEIPEPPVEEPVDTYPSEYDPNTGNPDLQPPTPPATEDDFTTPPTGEDGITPPQNDEEGFTPPPGSQESYSPADSPDTLYHYRY